MIGAGELRGGGLTVATGGGLDGGGRLGTTRATPALVERSGPRLVVAVGGGSKLPRRRSY